MRFTLSPRALNSDLYNENKYVFKFFLNDSMETPVLPSRRNRHDGSVDNTNCPLFQVKQSLFYVKQPLKSQVR